MGAHMVVDIGGVRQGVSELLQACKWCKVSVAVFFCAVLKLRFGLPNLGERRPLWGWAFVVSEGTPWFPTDHRCLLWFCRSV